MKRNVKFGMIGLVMLVALFVTSCAINYGDLQGTFITVENRDNDSWRHVRRIEIFLADDDTPYLRQDELLVYGQSASYGIPSGKYYVRVFASLGTDSQTHATSEPFELREYHGVHLRFYGRSLK